MKGSAAKLFEIAESQQGYFTFQQAIDAGFTDKNHAYHLRIGDWIRTYRGIYRLANYPLGEREELVKWCLWSRNRSNTPQGVFSHYTALDIYELSDHMLTKVHMTVPLNFRRMAAIPEILVLHRKKLRPNEIVERQGYQITTAVRTLIDVIEEGKLEAELIDQAVDQAVKLGLITKSKISQYENVYDSAPIERIKKILRKLK